MFIILSFCMHQNETMGASRLAGGNDAEWAGIGVVCGFYIILPHGLLFVSLIPQRILYAFFSAACIPACLR